MASDLAIEALNAGEISPLLSGRGSKDFYQAGLKTSLNMLPMVQGPAVQRSGTQFVCELKSSAARSALVRFEFNVTQAYVLEFGDQYMRVKKDHAIVTLTAQNITAITKANPAVLTYSGSDTYANGDKVFVSGVLGMIEVNNREFTVANVNTGANTFELSGVNSSAYTTYTSGGTVAEIYEIATPYLQADLFDTDGTLRLKFAQTADTLYIFHPGYAPRKLTRSGHTSWTLSTVSFLKGPFSAINNDDSVRVMCAASTYQPGDSVTIQANSAIFESGHVGSFFYLEELYLDQLSVYPWVAAQNNGSSTDQVSNDGNVYSIITAISTAWGNSAPVHTIGDAWDSAAGNSQRNKLRYLHSRWAIIQLTGFTDSKNMSGTIVTYLCNGLTPASKTVSNVTNSGGLFRVTATAHGFSEGDYVNIAGVTGSGGMTAAVNGDWKAINVATNTFDLAGSTFVGAFSSAGTTKRYATWKWAHGAFSAARGYPAVGAFFQERLALAQTTEEPDSVWLSESGNYESFAPRTANQVLATNAVAVTLANGEVNKIENMLSQSDGLVLMTATAEFLLQPATNTAALGPDNVQAPLRSSYGSRGVQPAKVGKTAFYVQRAGRKVRDLGYDAATGVSDNPIGSDLIIYAEHLTVKYPIIDMAWAQEPDATLWAVRSDGALLSFTFAPEQKMFAWGPQRLGGYSDSGDTADPIVESVVSIPSPDGLQNEVWMIVKRYINGATKRYVEYLKPRWIDGDAVADAFMVDSGLAYSGSAVSSLSGLYHLAGETVSVLADGKVHAPVVVSAGGGITLNYAASKITVGLAMTARLQTMRIEHPTQTGSAQGKRKIVTRAAIRLVHSNHVKFGGDFTTMLRESLLKTTSLYDTPVTLMSDDLNVDWPGAWDNNAYLCFENDLPVPFGICAIYPQVETVNA